MTTQSSQPKPEEELQREAEAAKKRLFQTIDRIEGKAKTVARVAVDTTRVSGWGLLGAAALWAGVVLLTRAPRAGERRAGAALMLRSEPKRSLPVRLAIVTSQACAAVLGFVLMREWAVRVLSQYRPDVSVRASATPQVRQLGVPVTPSLPTGTAPEWQARGTPNA